MLKSMTGYGVATVELDTLIATFEVKTLNSKFLDIYCRLPKNYSDREIEVRNLLTQQLERGKVECTLTIQPNGNTTASSIVNRPLVKAYFNDLEETAKELQFQADKTEILRMAIQLPNAFNNTEIANEERKEKEWTLIKGALDAALKKTNLFRTQEGALTTAKFHEYLNQIRTLLTQVEAQDVHRIPGVRDRLEKAVKELVSGENFDTNRFEQELIYYVERFDISEEKVRLANHLDYFKETLDSPESNGKKLNFIAQEIGREINTIGSKANDAVIQRLVVQMKDELEKIKEQTMNII